MLWQTLSIIIIIIEHSPRFLGTMFRLILGSHGGGPLFLQTYAV